MNVTWLCTKASPTFARTFSGTLLNLTQRLHQCTPELFWAENLLGKNFAELDGAWPEHISQFFGAIVWHTMPGNCVSELPWIGKNDYVFGFCHH